MKKAVITGGAGFIGSNLTDELIKRDYDVVAIDNLATGNLANLAPAMRSGRVEFIEGSISSRGLLRKTFAGAEFVFHQAALPSVPRSIKNPLASNNTNVSGTLNVLLAARDAGVRKVVYASSSSVYGDTPTLPKSEEMVPNPQSPYAVTKLAGEYYCRVFQKVYGLETACLRYFNVYGPRQDPASPYAAVIPLFLRRIIGGQAPVIHGDGEQSRDFTYVGDVARANVLAAESAATGVFNVGSSRRITINELARLIASTCGNPGIKPEHVQPRPGDVRHSLADISKLAALGYRPEVSIEEGIKITCREISAGQG